MVSPRWLSGVTDMQVFGDQVSNLCSFKQSIRLVAMAHTKACDKDCQFPLLFVESGSRFINGR